MSHYLLVHGAWEESRAWEDVTPVLEQSGHRVTALDLPGHGANMQPIADMNMGNYIKTVIDAINDIGEPVVLVAHSMSGSVVSQVAEQVPEKIERLIYVAAFLLETGGTVLEAMQSDSGEFLPSIIFSEDGSYATLPEETLRNAGFHDVSEQVIQRFLPLIVEKQSTEPFMSPVAMTAEKFGTVKKTYIRTTIDRVTTPDLQDRMIENWKVEQVHNLVSGHFPAFSVPQKLAELML
ncbi:MAG: alpha/beta fold hydrolase [Halieaceae bacterium]|jgi:pimeloyl-ACP methyl ester carboxylesterase|nr:alpha/beta fold hydrolase [Halieaceae bacterium]